MRVSLHFQIMSIRDNNAVSDTPFIFMQVSPRHLYGKEWETPKHRCATSVRKSSAVKKKKPFLTDERASQRTPSSPLEYLCKIRHSSNVSHRTPCCIQRSKPVYFQSPSPTSISSINPISLPYAPPPFRFTVDTNSTISRIPYPGSSPKAEQKASSKSIQKERAESSLSQLFHSADTR